MAKAKKITQTTTKKIKTQATILYIFLIALFISTAFSLFKAAYIEFTLKLLAFIIFLVSIKLIDKGLEAQKEYENSKIAFAPKFKYKLFGAVLLGLDVFFINSFINHSSLINSLFLTILTILGVIFYYGLDPKVDKIPQASGVNMQKMIKELKEAQEKIDFIKEAQKDIDDLRLKEAINKAAIKAEHILETIKEDPKDIKVARKFIVIYLDGIKDVINQYNNIDKTKLDDSFRVRLIELLELASSKFDKELDRLKSNEIFDLDVQIDALKQQLKE